MSLPRWTETLEEYCQLIPIQPQVEGLSNKEIFEWQFEQFMRDVEYEFNVFDSGLLNEELKTKFNKIFLYKYISQQVGGASSPEYRFKMNFERIFLENIDRMNGRLRVQLVSLKEIEDTLLDNYNLKTVYEENLKNTEQTDTITSDKNNYEANKNTTDTEEQTKESTKNRKTDNTNRNFNRNIYQETPSGQLNLTAQDGKGLIETATTITEDLENQTSNESRLDTDNENENRNRSIIEGDSFDQTKSGTRDVDKNQDQQKDSVRHITGYQNLGSKPKLLNEYQTMYQNVLQEFVNCFDKLFRYVY